MKKVVNIILLFILILSSCFPIVRAVKITDKSLDTSIKKINDYLEDKIDTKNPSYLTEIVDENNNVPTYEYYPKHIASRSIKTLKAHDGKIFMGLGDWNDNTGPVKVIYYDTKDEKIKSSGTIADEAIQKFTIIDDTLYTTGCDPRAGWGEGSYYTYNKEENKWEQHKNKNGWIHVFNIVEFKDKLFICGSTVDTMKTSTIQSSSDNGETFESVKVIKNGKVLPYDSELRCYNLVVYDNNLYGYIYYDTYSGVYKYDEKTNEFNYISKLPSSKYSQYGIYRLAFYNMVYLQHEIFNNEFVYVSGTSLYKSNDLITFNEIKTDTEDVIQDVVVNKDTLYTLSYAYNSDKTFTTRIYKTKNLLDFDLVYEFVTDTPPLSIEYYDENFYIGTGDGTQVTCKDSSKNGSFYRINLKDAKKSLKINKDDKIINIYDNKNVSKVKYNLDKDDYVFNIDLSFNNEMSSKQWEQEYNKIENLKLIFATIADINGIEIDKSIKYFDNVFSKKVTKLTGTYSNAIEYAENLFTKELDVQDELFTITSKTISKDTNEYKKEVVLTINGLGNYSSLKPITNNTDNDKDDNNEIDLENNKDNNIQNNKDKTDKVDKIPQAGKFFSFKDLVQSIIYVSIIAIVILVIKERKHRK